MASLNLADVMNQIGEFQQVLRGDREQAAGALEQNRQIGEERVAAAQKLIGTATRQAEIENEQKLRMEERKAATAAAFGTDILKPENRLAYLAGEQAAAVDEALENAKRARDLKDMNLFDNPLDYMLVRPFAHRNDNAAVAASERAKIAKTAIDDLNRQTQETVQTQAAINQTFNQEQAALRLEEVRAKSEDALRTLRMNQNVQLINDLTVLRGMDEKSINMSVTGYKLKNEAAEFAQRMALGRANLERHNKEKKDEKIGMEMAWQAYNRAAKKYEIAPIASVAEYAATLKSPLKDKIAFITGEGMKAAVMSEGGGTDVGDVLGASPGQSVLTALQITGRIPGKGKTAEVLKVLTGQQREVALKQGKGKNVAELLATNIDVALNGAIQSQRNTDGSIKSVEVPGLVKDWKADTEADARGYKNIYRAPDTATIAAAVPKLTETRGWKEIILPATNTSAAPSAAQVLKQAQIALAAGKVTPEEAANSISAYYKAAVSVNNTTEQYRKYGLDNQTDYVTAVPYGKRFLGADVPRPVNLTNEQDIQRTLIVNMMQAKFGVIGRNPETLLSSYEWEQAEKQYGPVKSKEIMQARFAAERAAAK